MRKIRTEDAVGHVLCHDMTQIIPGEGADDKTRFKGVRFKKGHVVEEADIPVLLSMGKEHLFVWELGKDQLHENDAAYRMAALCHGENCVVSKEPHEGKLTITAAVDGVFELDAQRLNAVNAVDEVMIATRRGHTAVKKGTPLAGTRVIPLVVDASVVEAAEVAADVAQRGALMRVAPFCVKTAALIATGAEVQKGLIEDKFTPVVEQKLAAFGIKTVHCAKPGDDMDALVAAIHEARDLGVDLIACTGGMSVDPDDNTPGAIKRSGARIVTYGAPVLPGAMMCLGYLDAADKGTSAIPVLGLPGCVMYSATTVFDLVLPRIAAGIELTKRDFVVLGEGGLIVKE